MPLEKNYEFNRVTQFTAKAMGVPGKRTFFLIIAQKDKWVRVWLEKNLLETLSMAIEQFLETLAKQDITVERGTGPASSSENLPSRFPSAELEVDEMTLGFDREQATINILVHGMGPLSEAQAELSCHVTLAQLEKLADEAKTVCAAGRPRCSVCGLPIDPGGHVCPGHN